MNSIASNKFSSGPNIYAERERLKRILCPICGMAKAERIALGFLNNLWTFKCAGSIVGSDEKYFRVVDEDLEIVKQKVLNQINGNGKE